MKEIDELKREVFFRLLEMASRAYILVRHSDAVVIGNRGFSEEEKENGIVLVFNKNMKFVWDDTGIRATLVFGTLAEKCHIPSHFIVSVYSPDLGIQLMVAPDSQQDYPSDARQSESDEKIIRVDFKKKGM